MSTADGLTAVRELCNRSTPYDWSPDNDALFARAMGESVRWHFARNAAYAELCRRSGFDPENPPRSADDCARIPFFLANFFKYHEILSIPREEVTLHLTSSGTRGQKSQIFFDPWSIEAPQRMVDWIFGHHGWITPKTPANYLLFTYESERDTKLGTAYTDHYLCKYAPIASVFFALRRNGSEGHDFDVHGTIDALRRFEASGLPLRIFGFPAFLHFTLERMRALRLEPMRFPETSLVFLGGGWKGHSDRTIPKVELYAEARRWLGIPDARLRDGFGSVEHCIPYIECERHRFHVPIWSRVFTRDPWTLERSKPGEAGLLHFVSPYITSVPAHSILMTDRARVHDAGSCGCAIATPWFEVLGRAGTTQNRSCAVAASEILARAGGGAGK